jgi:hypothetical protein
MPEGLPLLMDRAYEGDETRPAYSYLMFVAPIGRKAGDAPREISFCVRERRCASAKRQFVWFGCAPDFVRAPRPSIELIARRAAASMRSWKFASLDALAPFAEGQRLIDRGLNICQG